MKCRVCDRVFKNNQGLGRHLKSHKISSRDYYDKYLRSDPEEHICNSLDCNNEVKFDKLRKGYSKYCSRSCSSKERTKDPEYQKFHSDKAKEQMKNPKYHSNIQRSRFKKKGINDLSVYIAMFEDDHIKVGISSNLVNRMRGLNRKENNKLIGYLSTTVPTNVAISTEEYIKSKYDPVKESEYFAKNELIRVIYDTQIQSNSKLKYIEYN